MKKQAHVAKCAKLKTSYFFMHLQLQANLENLKKNTYFALLTIFNNLWHFTQVTRSKTVDYKYGRFHRFETTLN